MDLSDTDSIVETLEQNITPEDDLTTLINNAATGGEFRKLHSYDTEQFKKVLNINLTSPFIISKFAISMMVTTKPARIVNICCGGIGWDTDKTV